MRKFLTRRALKWGVAIICAMALVGGTLAWQLGERAPAGGEVVAQVDGVPITRAELHAQVQQQMAMMQMGGQEIDDAMYASVEGMVLENMISVMLVTREAERRGIEVDDEAVKSEMDALVLRYFEGDEEALEAALSDQGLSLEDLEDDIRDQMRLEAFIDDYVEAYLAEADVEVSEEEMRQLYAQYAEVSEDLPDFADMEPDLRRELLQIHEQEALQILVQKLREERTVEIYQ